MLTTDIQLFQTFSVRIKPDKIFDVHDNFEKKSAYHRYPTVSSGLSNLQVSTINGAVADNKWQTHVVSSQDETLDAHSEDV